MIRSIMILAVGLVLLSAASGSALDDYDRNGLFVGVAGSCAFDTFEHRLEDEINAQLAALGYMAALSLDKSLGINGRIGYRFHPNFSAEVEVEWLHGFESGVSLLAPPLGKVATVDIEPITVTGNAKAHLLTGRYQPFLRVGAGVMTAEATVKDSLGVGLSESERDSGFAMRLGGGFDFHVDDSFLFSVGADYVLPFGNMKDLDYVSIKWGIELRRP